MSPLTISFMAGISGFLIVWTFYSINRSAVERGKTVQDETELAQQSAMLRMVIPYIRILRGLAPPLLLVEVGGKRKTKSFGLFTILWDALSQKINRWLITADYPLNLTTVDFYGIIFFCIFLAGGIFAYLFYLMGKAWVGSIAFMAIIYPFAWLSEKAGKRQKEVLRTLPYALDLLCLAIEAGLDFNAALPRIMPKLGTNALAVEFGRMMREIRMGRPRREALKEVSHRCDVSDLTIVVSAIVQADELGTSLGPILRIQSEMIRGRRFQRAEKLAMEAPVKMLFPLMAFIFPTVFIIIFGPIAIKYFLSSDSTF